MVYFHLRWLNLKKEKIVIFYAAFGSGHLSAARNVKEYIDANYPNAETILIDCITYANKVFSKVSSIAFEEMGKNIGWAWKIMYENADEDGSVSKLSHTANRIFSIKVGKLLNKIKPDIVISTHPFASQICSILKKKGKIDFKLATIITDYAPHRRMDYK
jgi:processive 1,2-diacylglycerol beta-glucosyltransferase